MLRAILIASVLVFSARAEHRGAMDQQQQQQPQQQQQQGGGMGGGGGGGEGAKYESKREELQKAFEQPAKEAMKAMNTATDNFAKETNKALESTLKNISASTPKDEPLNEKIAAGLTPVAPGATTTKEAVNGIISDLDKLSQVSAAMIMKKGEGLLNSIRPPVQEVATTGEQIQNATGGADRTPSSVTDNAQSASVQNHGAGATAGLGFRRGLLHNPPRGLRLEE